MLLHVSQSFTRLAPTLSLIGFYAASFYCSTFALNTFPIAVICATWSGLGMLLLTVFGYLVFEQALDWRAIVGLLLIVTGVVLVNSSAPHKQSVGLCYRLIPACIRCAFQLAGGLRDHYTSRAKFILFAKADPTPPPHYMGGREYWQVTR